MPHRRIIGALTASLATAGVLALGVADSSPQASQAAAFCDDDCGGQLEKPDQPNTDIIIYPGPY